jgi:hypothetical protein
MLMTMPIAIPAWTLAIFTICCPSAVAAAPRTASLCEIAAKPTKWRGRMVRVTATYITDRFHYTLLKDDRCPKVWFSPGDSKNADHSVGAFYNVVMGDVRSLHRPLYSVDIIGRVSYRRREANSAGRIAILRVLSYRQFERPHSPE